MATSYGFGTPDLFNRMQQWYSKKMITTGRAPTQQEIQAMIAASMEAERQRAFQYEQLSQRNRQLDQADTELSLKAQAMEDAKDANQSNPMQTGVNAIGGLGSAAMGYAALDKMGVFGADKVAPAGSSQVAGQNVPGVTPAATGNVTSTASGIGGVTNLTPAGSTAIDTMMGGPTAIDTMMGGPAEYSAMLSTETAGAGAMEGAGSTLASTAAEEGGAAAVEGGLGMSAISYGAPFAAGLAGGYLGGEVGKWAGEQLGIGGERERSIVGGTLGGAGAGAATGFAIGGPPGALIGSIIGGITGGVEELFDGGCIIITAATGRDSEEVNITRRYRDKFMDAETLRGYYRIAEPTVKRMKEDPEYKAQIKDKLVNNLIEYCAYKNGEKESCSDEARKVSAHFLARCRYEGALTDSFTRCNSEVV